jgi:hypothetical protein
MGGFLHFVRIVLKKGRKVNKDTKTYRVKELRKLKKKCLKLWSLKVRALAGNVCVLCGTSLNIHAHHLEDYRLCSALRFDIRNGLSVCASNHKFSKDAVHKSFITIYDYMIKNRSDDIEYLRCHRNDNVEFTKEYLLGKIKELGG